MTVTENWIETYRGHRLDVFRPDANEIDIEDIAHALSMTPRFRGMTRWHHSVAQHSVNVVEYLRWSGVQDSRVLLTGLLHDAAEAYLGDLPTPIKAGLPEFRAVEDHLLAVILGRFGGQYPLPEPVVVADHRLLHWEAGVLMPDNTWSMSDPVKPNSVDLSPWQHGRAEAVFLDTFRRL